jgi:putative Ca2+/H+ antiporter (TMEM165/GDT1 family)
VSWRDSISCIILSYWTVLGAELIGDRSIYTVTSLAVRFRSAMVYGGITAAFLAKMLVAVWCGSLLAHLPATWTGAISAATFFVTSVCLWVRKPEPARPDAELVPSWRNAVTLSFCTVFFSEWADYGQLSAAALTARYDAPASVWLGGSLALCTKGALAMTLGLSLRRRIPSRIARVVSTGSCLALGCVALFDLLR